MKKSELKQLIKEVIREHSLLKEELFYVWVYDEDGEEIEQYECESEEEAFATIEDLKKEYPEPEYTVEGSDENYKVYF